jgi:hypothetical protein
VPIPAGEIVARILSRMRQKLVVDHDNDDSYDVEEVQALAQAMRGRPAITCAKTGSNFPLYSALTTLPVLPG